MSSIIYCLRHRRLFDEGRQSAEPVFESQSSKVRTLAFTRVQGDRDCMQVPMSKFEPEQFIDDRYKKMDDRLKVSRLVPA